MMRRHLVSVPLTVTLPVNPPATPVLDLERGITKWQVREFSDYVDVFNTTAKHPR